MHHCVLMISLVSIPLLMMEWGMLLLALSGKLSCWASHAYRYILIEYYYVSIVTISWPSLVESQYFWFHLSGTPKLSPDKTTKTIHTPGPGLSQSFQQRQSDPWSRVRSRESRWCESRCVNTELSMLQTTIGILPQLDTIVLTNRLPSIRSDEHTEPLMTQ